MTDLLDRMVNALCAVPAPERQRHHWVMSREWYDELAKVAGWHSWEPAKTALGLPLKVQGDGGFPHLVPGFVGTSADADTLARAADILMALSRKPSSIILGAICKFLRDQAAKIRAEV